MSALRKTVSLVHNGDAWEIVLEPQGAILVMDKVLRFRNNQNVVGTEEDFTSLDRSTRRAIIKAVNKEFKKVIEIRKHV